MELLLQEAHSKVSVIENGIQTKMSALKAGARRFKNAALSGDRVSNRRFIAMTHAAQQQTNEAERVTIATIADYKWKWTQELQRRRDEGEAHYDPIPHPEDLVIDTRTGEVRINGPADDLEKAEWDQAESDRQEAQRTIEYIQMEIDNPRRGYHVDWLTTELTKEAERLAEINRNYPPEGKRRQPGFSLSQWRAKKKRVIEPEAGKKSRSRVR